MIEFKNLIVLLPCHGLEDFPGHHVGENAESLLANWTALWHPGLIAAAGKIPTWLSIDFVTGDLSNSLILVPTLCAGDIPTEVSDAATTDKAVLIAGCICLEEIFGRKEIGGRLDGNQNSEIVDDFLALGYSFLQVQLMTRQLRYSSAIDKEEFSKRVVAAARKWRDDDAQQLRSALESCFDLLLEERNNYYPTNPKLLELILTSQSATDPGLTTRAGTNQESNVLMTGRTAENLTQTSSPTLAAVNRLLKANLLDLAGGLYDEIPLELVSIESLIYQLESGTRSNTERFDSKPIAFASLGFCLSPQLPGILDQFKFEFAIHSSFSGGSLPSGASPIMNWQGRDGTNISAVSTPPIDAMQPEGFLKLGVTIGELLDSHHHCPLIFAHWPGRTSFWFRILRRIEKFGPLFGQFETLSRFGETMYDNGFSESYAADEYRFPRLESLVENGSNRPISAWAAYWRAIMRIRAIKNLITMLCILRPAQIRWPRVLDQLTRLQQAAEQLAVDHAVPDQSVADQITRFVIDELQIKELNEDTFASVTDDCLLINPVSFQRSLEIPGKKPEPGDRNVISLDGFEVTAIHQKAFAVNRNDPSVLFEDQKTGQPGLRNEFFELQIDEDTGGIRSINRHRKHGNLFSQQLAIRLTENYVQHGFPRNRSRYTRMQVELIRTTNVSNVAASITTNGILLDAAATVELNAENQVVARYEQTASVTRGRNRIEFQIKLETVQAFTGKPWRNYACSRIAWPSEDAILYRSENEIRESVDRTRFTAPFFVEVDLPDAKLSLLPGGLPFHRRSDRRMLDTLLMVRGETENIFEFAIAVDSPTSAQAATDYLSPCFATETGALTDPCFGWIFHLNCKNVVVTSNVPVFNGSQKLCGMRMRLQETEGRSGELTVSCPFKLQSACRINFLNEQIAELKIEEDTAFCNFSDFQFFQVELRW